MRLLIKIKVTSLHTGLPTPVHGLSDNHKDGRVIISVHSMSEQHQKALSAAGRFNPLIAKLGSVLIVSFRLERVANTCSHDTKCAS